MGEGTSQLGRADVSRLVVMFVREQGFPAATEASNFDTDVPVDGIRRRGWALRIRARVTVAAYGKLSTDSETEDTLSRVGGGFAFDWAVDTDVRGRVRSVYQTLDIAYEGDQSFDDAALLVEYLVTYSGPGIGAFYPTRAAVQLRFWCVHMFSRRTRTADRREKRARKRGSGRSSM